MSESDPNRVEEEFADAISTLPKPLQEIAASLPFPSLHHACMAGHLDLIRALLNVGLPADLYPETDDEDDEPPLTWLARDRATASPNALQVAALLIEHCEDIDEGNPLAAALEAGDVSMVRLLLAAGADEGLARQEVELVQAQLLDALLEPYWSTSVGSDPKYFIAFDSRQAIYGVGLSEAEAQTRARPGVDGQLLKSMAATERLVAALLVSEELSWYDDGGVADLDDREKPADGHT